MKNNSYYFPHDYHARFDPKLCALIKDFGMIGYGTWWNLVEILHEQGGKIEKFPKLFQGLAHDLKHNEADLKQIISALINDYYLLKEDDTHIWSERVLRNMQDLEYKRLQKVEAGRLGGIKSGQKRSKKQSKLKQNEALLEANEQKESKVKESKVDSNTDFFSSLKTNLAYKHINIEIELAKMDTWLSLHPGRQKTKKFIVNWLNKIETPIGPTQPQVRRP